MHDESTSLTTAGEQLYPLLRIHGIDPFEFRGRPAFTPRQVAKALGYASPKRMLSWLAASPLATDGRYTDILTGAELAEVKGLDVPGLVGGRTSWRETILLLPGLMLILDESRKAQASALAGPYRAWLRAFTEPAFAHAGKPTASPPPPQELLAGPVDLLKEAVRLDADVLARSCGATWLRAQARAAAERELAEAARAVDERKRERAAVRRSAREERAAAAGRRRQRKTTLW
jgi:hypothetical protein